MTQAGDTSRAVIVEQETEPSIVLSPVARIWQAITERFSGRLLPGILLFLIALGFNLYRLGNPSIWFDEAFSVELARQPLPLLWRIIFGPEPNMELYYLFLHFWLGLTHAIGFNQTEFVVRFPSAIFATLSTVVLFLLGKRFINTPVAVIGSLLYLLNYQQLVYAQQTRSYSLQLLLLCIAWYALFAAVTCTRHPRRWLICYVLAMVLAVYAHLFSILILLAQVVAVMGLLLFPNPWREQVRRQGVAAGISLLAIIILSVPMLLVSRHGASTGWNPVPHWGELINLFLFFTGFNKYYLPVMVGLCVASVVVVAIAYGWYVWSKGRSRTDGPRDTLGNWLAYTQSLMPVTWGLCCWLLLPIIVSYVISHGSLHLFSPRYLVTVVPPLCLLMVLGISLLRHRALQVVLVVALVCLALTSVPMYYRSAQVEDWNSTSHWLLQHYQSNDGLVCYDNTLQQGCQVSVEYYLHAYPNDAHFTTDAPGAFSWEQYGPARAAGPDEAVDPVALAAYAAKHPRLFFIQGRIRDDASAQKAASAQQWLDSHYRLIDKIETRTVTIRLYAIS